MILFLGCFLWVFLSFLYFLKSIRLGTRYPEASCLQSVLLPFGQTNRHYPKSGRCGATCNVTVGVWISPKSDRDSASYGKCCSSSGLLLVLLSTYLRRTVIFLWLLLFNTCLCERLTLIFTALPLASGAPSRGVWMVRDRWAVQILFWYKAVQILFWYKVAAVELWFSWRSKTANDSRDNEDGSDREW